ncbi:UXT homolog [Olea europaea subsp. europaea]|uniref:UXT homolog n=1 Tax=Olea europaea subsp. europaea TaxID=158383 RepID=A0A8S0UT57_OLEEU|nr:UXT homolog [Olea europaea subsp. europaea]
MEVAKTEKKLAQMRCGERKLIIRSNGDHFDGVGENIESGGKLIGGGGGYFPSCETVSCRSLPHLHPASARSCDSATAACFQRDNMNSELQEKVGRFEEFIDQRLKPDLVHAIAERDKVFEQQKIFSDLRRNIENLEKNCVTSLRTMVNLGSEVYMQADVPDTRHIFVDVGLGFHVEFTWPEALNFISAREEKLARQIEEYTQLIASIKAQIKMVHEGIRELLELPVQ